MAKKPTISNISSGYASTTTLNSNFTALRDGFDNTLSLDGSTPNSMNADLDMNSNDILNANIINTSTLKIDGTVVAVGDLSAAGATLNSNSHTGNGSTTAFSMSYAPVIKDNTQVYIDGVYQEKSTYSISGTTLTFSEAPPLNSGIEIVVTRTLDFGAEDAANINYTQGGTGSVNRTVLTKLQETVSVKDFGAVGDGVADDTAAIQAAIDATPATGGCVFFPETSSSYLCSSALNIATGKNSLHLRGESKYVELKFTSTTANGITIAGEHDNLLIENLYLNATNNSSGIAVSSIATGSASPLRDFEFKNVNIAGFLKGFVIYGHLNGLIQGGRQGGQGKAVSGGVGIQLGEDISNAGNGIVLDQVFVSNYETGVYNKYASPTTIRSCLIGGSSVGLKNATGRTIGFSGQLYYDSNNDTRLDNAGYLFNYAEQVSSLGTQTFTTTSKRIHWGGHSLTRIKAVRATTNQSGIVTSTWTKVQLNSTDEDVEVEFDTATNYRFTATRAGWYQVTGAIWWRAAAADKPYHVAIYKNGSVESEQRSWSNVAGPESVAVNVTSLIWLDVSDYVELYGYHEEGVNSEIIFGGNKTYMTITDA